MRKELMIRQADNGWIMQAPLLSPSFGDNEEIICISDEEVKKQVEYWLEKGQLIPRL